MTSQEERPFLTISAATVTHALVGEWFGCVVYYDQVNFFFVLERLQYIMMLSRVNRSDDGCIQINEVMLFIFTQTSAVLSGLSY